MAGAVAARPTDVLVSFDPAAGVQAMRSASASYPDAAHREQGVQAAASSYAKAKTAALQRAGSGASTKRDFDHLPVQLVHVTSSAALQRLAGDPDVTSLNLPRAFAPAVDNDLTQINQPQAISNGLTGAGTAGRGPRHRHRHQPGRASAPARGGQLAHRRLPHQPTQRHRRQPHRAMRTPTELHGTNVAGIVIKVAPEVRIDDYQIFSGPSTNLQAQQTDVMAALERGHRRRGQPQRQGRQPERRRDR